jgi:integrase/recombinase XerD
MSSLRDNLEEVPLTSREIGCLIQACSNRAPSGIRNRALIMLAWRSGLRTGELLALEPQDIDLDIPRLVVQDGEGGRSRIVMFDRETAALVERWLAARTKLGIEPFAPLFCTLNGGAIQQSYVRHLLPRLARRAGIRKRCHAGALRHAFALRLAGEGLGAPDIVDRLGYSSGAAGHRYLRRHGIYAELLAAQDRETSDVVPTLRPRELADVPLVSSQNHPSW